MNGHAMMAGISADGWKISNVEESPESQARWRAWYESHVTARCRMVMK
jgi:hypothetical protein